MIVAIAVSLAAGVAPALAASPGTAVPVAYGDLDLGNQADAAVLLGRLRHAAMQACGASDFSVPDYRWAVARSACFRHSLERAVQTVGSPTLSELARG